MSATPAVDWKLCLELANNRAELAKELIDMFAQDIPNAREAITKAFEQEDMEMLNHQAHRFHGACCYCGVPTLKQIAHDLEAAAEKKDSESVALLIHQMTQEMERVEVAVKTQSYMTE